MFVFGILLSHSPFGFRFMITCDIFVFHYRSVGISKLQPSECVFGSVFSSILFALVWFYSKASTPSVCVYCVANFDQIWLHLFNVVVCCYICFVGSADCEQQQPNSNTTEEKSNNKNNSNWDTKKNPINIPYTQLPIKLKLRRKDACLM